MNNLAAQGARRIAAIRPRALSGGTLSNRIEGCKNKHHPFLPRCPSTRIFSSATSRSTRAEMPLTPLALHMLGMAAMESFESVRCFLGRLRFVLLLTLRVDSSAGFVIARALYGQIKKRQSKIA